MNAEETAAAFKAPKGERGPCPEGGIYSGGEKYPKDVGFCCDKAICNVCGGVSCDKQIVRFGREGSTAATSNVCCSGWLKNNDHFTPCSNGSLPCAFEPPPLGAEWDSIQSLTVLDEDPAAKMRSLEESKALFTAKSGPKRAFGTCAVISSSPSMLDSQYGEDIDKHDVVIRFNMAKTVGYEDDVGARTSLMLANDVVANRPSQWIPACPTYELGIWFLFDFMPSRVSSFTKQRVKVYAPNDCKYTINKNYTTAFKNPWQKVIRSWVKGHRVAVGASLPRLSTGWIGILHTTLGGLCKTVDLYGWDRGPAGTRFSAGHYYDPLHNYTAHAYSLETILIDYYMERYNYANREWGASMKLWPWKNPAKKPKGDGTFDR